MMRVTRFHAIRSPSVSLKTADTIKKWSQMLARCIPEETQMCVLRCHSQVRHLEWRGLEYLTASNIERNSTSLEL
jgi:hypothetical protein